MSEHLHTGFRAVPGPMSFMAEVEMREPPLPFSRLRPAVDRAQPPPEALEALVCELWTAGVTRVEISGTGYDDFEQTLTPVMSEECEGFLPRKVDIELVPAVDGGTDG